MDSTWILFSLTAVAMFVFGLWVYFTKSIK
jgi:hypothetical protein